MEELPESVVRVRLWLGALGGIEDGDGERDFGHRERLPRSGASDGRDAS